MCRIQGVNRRCIVRPANVTLGFLQCYLQDIDLELAALEEGNRNRAAELTAYAELDNIADEDEQEPPGMLHLSSNSLSLLLLLLLDIDAS